MSGVHITALEVENVKRIQAVSLEPSPTGLTVIGGANNQGKTSVLDAIAWALGGDRYRPDNVQREGASAPARLKVTLSNGIIVERRGKNCDLKVTDPSGRRGGQQLLNSFVEELALNLPKFMEASDREKADTLLRIIGVGDRLRELEQKEQQLYHQRTYTGQQRDQKAKYARELPFVPDAPAEPVSASELIRRQQDILLRNAENQRKRRLVDPLQYEMSIQAEDLADYVPAFGWEVLPPTAEQQEALSNAGILPDGVESAGKARLLLDRLAKRREEGLTTPKQIRFLEQRGFRSVGTWSFASAKHMIDRIASNGWKTPRSIVPAEYKPGEERADWRKDSIFWTP